MIITQQPNHISSHPSYPDPTTLHPHQALLPYNQFIGFQNIDYNAIINHNNAKNNLTNSKMKTSLCNKWT